MLTSEREKGDSGRVEVLESEGEEGHVREEVDDAGEGTCACVWVRGRGEGEEVPVVRAARCAWLGLREDPGGGDGQWKGKKEGKVKGVGVSGRSLTRGVEGAEAGKGTGCFEDEKNEGKGGTGVEGNSKLR